MSFSRENVSRVRAAFMERRQNAEAECERRKDELHQKIPGLWEIDREISSVGVRVMGLLLNGGDVQSAVEQMHKEHDALRTRRAELLVAAGYPADYSDRKYQCDKCQDTGFVDTKMCTCMRRALILAGYESSGIGTLMERQNFDSFTLDYYTGTDRENMRRNADVLSAFANDFAGRKGENFLLIGSTGLGKTHLSTSVARVVIDGGFDVVYDTAQGMFSVFEAQRFGHSETAEDAAERYLDCDLLIIDDLGTEMTNQFTISCLYNVVNTRINRRLSTVINTNLTGGELRDRYADRITSRLFGEFRPLLFAGKDVRAQKLKEGK